MDLQAVRARVQHILKDPVGVWDTIRNESPDPKDLIINYVLPLAVISSISQFIRMAVIGISIPFIGTVRVGVMSALVDSIIYIGAAIAGLFALSFVFAAIAPKFQGTSNQMRALQLLAYGSTGMFVGGVVMLVPIVGWLLSFGFSIYGLYTLYQGITPMLEVPREKRPIFFGASLLAMVVLGLLFQLVLPSRQPAGMRIDTPQGSFDTNDLNEATRNAEKFLKNLPK